MTTTRAGPTTPVRTESVALVATSTPATLSGTIPTTEMDLVDQPLGLEGPDSVMGGADAHVQQIPAGPARPQLKIMNPDCPVRYLPIHVWPEHLKKVQPRTGRKYCPKRSRTLTRRNGSSPLVQEYRCTEDEGEPGYEDQESSDIETVETDNGDDVDDSTTLTTGKRRGWGHTLLGAVQNAVPKRYKEKKQSHSSLPRKSLLLPPLRFGHRPSGLKKRGSRESAKW